MLRYSKPLCLESSVNATLSTQPYVLLRTCVSDLLTPQSHITAYHSLRGSLRDECMSMRNKTRSLSRM